MNDQTSTEQWPDRTLTPAQQQNRDAAALIPVSRSGAMPTNFAEMVDYAKFMSTAKGAVGAHLNGNVGACLAIMEISKQFDMPAYAVARQSYLVNNRIAFMGQFFLAVINKYCPLKEKLKWRYRGEIADGTRQITVYGTFRDETEAREWTSPELSKITPQNSPLWKTNPDHQLIYFGVRAWQTVNWPEGMLGIHTDDEVAAMEPIRYVGADAARDVTPGSELAARLRENQQAMPDEHRTEGFKEGFTEGHFERVDEPGEAVDRTIESGIAAASAEPVGAKEPPPAKDTAAPPADDAARKPKAKTKAQIRKEADEADKAAAAANETAEPEPKTVVEWTAYAKDWIGKAATAEGLRSRWGAEQKLRNRIGVTSAERDPIFDLYQQRLGGLGGE